MRICPSGPKFLRERRPVRNRVRRLERRDDPLGSRELLKRRERIVIADPRVLRAPHVFQPRVLRPDRRVVEPGGNRVRQLDVAVHVLQHIRARALQHAREPGRKARGMTACGQALPRPPRRRSVEPIRLGNERVEDAERVAATADARHDGIGQPSGQSSGTARAPRGRSRIETRGPSADTDAARAPSQAGSSCR